MKYLTFRIPSKEKKEDSKASTFEMLLEWILEKLLPKANPDFDLKYEDVVIWFVEYDEDNHYTNREIGLDKDGRVIVKGPFQNNLGYWVDNDLTLPNYDNDFNIQYIDKAVFEKLWEAEIN